MTPTPPSNSARPQRALPMWAGTLIVIVVLGAALWASRADREPVEKPAPASPPAAPVERPAPAHPAKDDAAQKNTSRGTGAKESPPRKTTIRNVTIRDEDREVVYRGDVDLAPTLGRIDAGRRLRFANDGSTFQNREGRLPRHPSGYYHEWVHPTPGLSGPGPQRVVTGEDGEAFYTPDHYRTFQRIR